MRYINDKIYGLPKPLHAGVNTSATKSRKDKEYIFKVNISKYVNGEKYSYDYYKVHIKRQNKSKIRYFKKLKDAKLFVELLRKNLYF